MMRQAESSRMEENVNEMFDCQARMWSKRGVKRLQNGWINVIGIYGVIGMDNRCDRWKKGE